MELSALAAGKPVEAAALDLTGVWQRCHAHLVPDPAHARLPAAQYAPCAFCGGPHAVEVATHVRYGASLWIDEARLRHCFDCGRFVLPGSAQDAHAAREPGVVGQPVTAVDARLWSATPDFLNIEPTTRCNFNCWYCVGRQMVQADIEVGNFAKVLDNFPGLKGIALVGEGEPLLHKGFFEMAAMARDRGIRVLMTSNGSAFSASVVRQLCETRVAYVSVSIDSVDAATFAESRIDGDLHRVWQGIQRLREYRDAHGFKFPKIGIKGTLFRHTEDQLLAIVDEAVARGADLFEGFQSLNRKESYVRIYPRHARPHLDDTERVDARVALQRDEALRRLPSAHAFCVDEGVDGSNSGRPNGMRPNCDEEWLYSLLSGHVTPCCQIKRVLDPDWNLFEKSVDDVLGNPHYERLRFNLWNGLFADDCAGCWKTLRSPA